MRRKSLLRQKKFSMWLNEVELNKLKLEAVRQGVAMSEIMRDYIRNLPDGRGERQTAERPFTSVRNGADRKSNRMRAIMTHVLGITGLQPGSA